MDQNNDTEDPCESEPRAVTMGESTNNEVICIARNGTKDVVLEDQTNRQETASTGENKIFLEDLDMPLEVKNEPTSKEFDTEKDAEDDQVSSMEMDSKTEELIITGLSDEILKLNPDFSTINDSGYGLRKRNKKVLKESNQLTKIRNPRKRNHIVHYSLNDEDRVQCIYCPQVFDTKTGLWNHMRMHKVKTLQDIKTVEGKIDYNTYKCMLCKEIFDTNTELVSHKKDAHSDEEPFTCNPCKVAFVGHYDYLMHKISHSVRSLYHCEECSKYFSTKTGYKLHIGSHFEKKLSCDTCGKKFTDEQALERHKSMHTEIRNYKTCGECGKTVREKKHMDYHMLTHTGVRPFQCLYCGKGFRSAQQRKIHTRVHTDERPFQCDTCNRCFHQSTDLKRHQESHKAKEKNIVCDYCEKKFLHRLSLQIHMRRHLKDNLFKCTQCDHTSTTRGNLRTHIIYKHTEETVHRCDICNIGFKTKMCYHKHVNTLKHRNKTYGAHKKGII